MQQQNVKRILLTGGHAATTAIAVIEQIKKTESLKSAQICFAGAKFAMEGFDVETIEYKILPKIGVKFYPIVSGRLQTKFTRYTLASLIKIPIGFIHAFFIIFKLKPNVVLSFGGFASFPVVFWSWIFGIPIILHEQTITFGRATKATSFFADKICLAREESRKYFPKNKCVVTGNPVSSSMFEVKPANREPKTILIMGGSRGSTLINKLAMSSLTALLKDYKIIHITGQKDFEEVSAFKNILPSEISKNYKVISVAEPSNMAKIYSEADIIVSRAGANTVSEVLAVRKPAIFIPLALSFADEQTKNAEYAQKFVWAKIISEKEANSACLLAEIDEIAKKYKKITDKMKSKVSPDKDASYQVVKIISRYL